MNGSVAANEEVFRTEFLRNARKFCRDLPRQSIFNGLLLCDTSSLGYLWNGVPVSWRAVDWLSNEEVLQKILQHNGVDISVLLNSIGGLYTGGEDSAWRLLQTFLWERFKTYKKDSELNEECHGSYGSLLSPYLSFGFISTAMIIREMEKNLKGNEMNVQSLMENLARRELAYHTSFRNNACDR